MNDKPMRRPRGRPKSSWSDEPAPTVQALDRGLLLLKALAKSGSLGLSELAMSVGVPTSSAHRLMATLESHGFASLDEATQKWSIGVQAFRVGAAFTQGSTLIETSREVMRALMEETGETANLAMADGGEVVFVSQVETQNPIRALFQIGARTPMHASGIGKALLAERPRSAVERHLEAHGLPDFTGKTLSTPARLFADLDATRARGWALDDEERHVGMRCVAATIHNVYGEAVAGVSVSAPRARFTDEVIAEIGPKVRRAAEAATEASGGQRALPPD
ncbi:MAG: HTH-type transcriptional regulator BhcR [Pseudomonadota bacterium]